MKPLTVMQHAAGIYRIRNLTNGKCYIGSAVHLWKRWRLHRNDLRKAKHHCAHLQKAWHKYGEDAFTFEPLLVCSRVNLIFYEQRALDAYNPEYNVCRVAGSRLGQKNTPEANAKTAAARKGMQNALGYRWTDDQKARQREAFKTRVYVKTPARLAHAIAVGKSWKGKKRPEHSLRMKGTSFGSGMTGHTHSDATKAKMRAARLGYVMSPESRAKLSAIVTDWWARKRACETKA